MALPSLILDDSRFINKYITLILIPPPNTVPFVCSYEYLSGHVIQLHPTESLTIISRHNKHKYPVDLKYNEREEQLLFTMGGSLLKASNGMISSIDYNKKAKITRTRLLYLNEDKDVYSHVLLYLDNSILSPPVPSKEVHSVDKCIMDTLMSLSNHNQKEVHQLKTRIDQLILSLCDQSILCDSLDQLHNRMENILTEGYNMLDETYKLQSNADMYNLHSAFESYIMEQTYDVVFFMITQLLLTEDKRLTSAIEEMEYLDFTQIGLPLNIKDGRIRVMSAIRIFERIGSYRTPIEKMKCLLDTVSELTEDNKGTFMGSDSFIPLLLMTLIKSKVPHLIANLVYMKDYIFQYDISSGKYGYSLSTLEGVLDYLLQEHKELSEFSSQNIKLWSAIESGGLLHQMNSQNDHLIDNYDACDTNGNNAFMIACIHGQADIARYMLKDSRINIMVENDMSQTPLICAVKSTSFDTVSILLRESRILSTIHTVDIYGNTAFLYVCQNGQLDLLKLFLHLPSSNQLIITVNITNGDTPLHMAQHSHSSQFILYLIHMYQSNHIPMHLKNNNKETFYHLCTDIDVISDCIEYLPDKKEIDSLLANDPDIHLLTPLMRWAMKGKLRLINAVLNRLEVSNFIYRVDIKGNTLLHLLAYYVTKEQTMEVEFLDEIVFRYRGVVNARDWTHGNTALHILADISSLASSPIIKNTALFMQLLIKYGATINIPNYRNEHPIHLTKVEQITQCLEDLYLRVEPIFIHWSTKNSSHFTWSVIRTCIEYKDNNREMYYVIKSGIMGNSDSMKTVKRRLEDFIFLRKELLYELAEIFLPTFRFMTDPMLIDLKPPPFPLIDTTLSSIKIFMNWLLNHPTLHNHDLVISFVRLPTDLQKTMIRDMSYSKRQLLLEKIYDLPLSHHCISTKNEEYFLKYTEEMMEPLKDSYYRCLKSARRVMEAVEDHDSEIQYMVKTLNNGRSVIIIDPLLPKIFTVCTQMYASAWPLLIEILQLSYGMIDGIMLSLQRPFWLINKREMIRNRIEEQKELLGRTRTWQGFFSTKERLKYVERDKEKVIESMNELNHTDSEISQSHQVISDELAHFQTIHATQTIRSIRSYVKLTLEAERYRLEVLYQTLAQFESSKSD
ncbi:hypothetical protein BDB01DRAFT_781005 [Pilobolus umbonatus]|nr:hypothetical protein BDB01DRAFT_781005 [Pilobolus umbonatus]